MSASEQHATLRYTQLLEAHQVQISMSDKGTAWQNGYAKRWMRTLKEGEVYLSDYETYEDARWQIGKFIDSVYNKKRIHSALGDLWELIKPPTPALPHLYEYWTPLL